MTPERIERALADLRDWLMDLPPTDGSPISPATPVDLHTLIGHFIALRHEVNLQTKVARATLEQNAETLRRFEEPVDEEIEEVEEVEEATVAPAEDLKPLFKAIIDVYDSLALAQKQVEKQRAGFLAGLGSITDTVVIEMPPLVPESDEPPSFWRRFLGNDPPPPDKSPLIDWHRQTTKKLKEREQSAREACDFIRDAIDGLLTGYAMSMNRIDRILEKFGLEVMRCTGQRFDPEMMEVVEAVKTSGRPLGEVIEETRRGYLWKGMIFRYAQVRVAR